LSPALTRRPAGRHGCILGRPFLVASPSRPGDNGGFAPDAGRPAATWGRTDDRRPPH